MKKSVLLFFAIATMFFYSFNNLQAQTKDDLVQCLSLILELPEMEDVYQNDVSSGQVAIIRQIESSMQPIAKLMRQIRTEDFADLYNTVEVWEMNDIQYNNIPVEYMLSYGITYDPEQQTMGIRMWTDLNEDRRTTVMGLFQLVKNEEDWEMLSQTVEKVPSRNRPPSSSGRN